MEITNYQNSCSGIGIKTVVIGNTSIDVMKVGDGDNATSYYVYGMTWYNYEELVKLLYVGGFISKAEYIAEVV